MILLGDDVEECPHCGSRSLVLDPVRGELVCTRCGTVCGRAYMVLLEIPGSVVKRREHKLEKSFAKLDEKYYVLASKLASVLGLAAHEVYKYFLHHMKFCKEQTNVDTTLCLVARTVADFAIRLGKPPVTFVKQVIAKIWRKMPSFERVAAVLTDYLKSYIANRKRIVLAEVMQALAQKRVPVNSELVRKIVDQVYKPDKNIKTLVREAVKLYLDILKMRSCTAQPRPS